MTKASKIISLAAVLVLALLALPIPTAHVAGAPLPSDVWVAPPPAGSDSNPGTEALPFATIQKGVDTVADYGTVHVAAGTYNDDFAIEDNLTLSGAGALTTFINHYPVEVNQPVIGISTGGQPKQLTVTISGFTVQNGNNHLLDTRRGGGVFVGNDCTVYLNNCSVFNNEADNGGGIYNSGTLYLNDCTISNNGASGGGGIYNDGQLIMNRCTVSGNSGGQGGGIQNMGSLYMWNCTISGNSASNEGGGIYNYPFGPTMTSEYSTIANNQATGTYSRGGGFSNWGQATFESTIVANNTAGNSDYNNGFTEPAQGGVTTSMGYNLCGDNSCGFNAFSDLVDTDPLLAPLQDNGGPTFTHALLHGSPAIDHGIGQGFPATDQRGVPRWQGTTCDTGAYELAQASVATATGSGEAYFSTLNGYITDLTALDESGTACRPYPILDFPFGLFSFTITGITPGSSVTVVIILPSNATTDTEYWKCLNGQWVDCTSLLGSNNGDSVLTLTITDGGLGDRDGVANGEISDPGGPAVAIAAALPPAKPRVSPTIPRPLNPSRMSVQYVSVSPKQTIANHPVTIITNVVNTGDEAGNLNIALKINGLVEQSRMVSVGPQGTQPVKFTVAKAQPGTYAVDIGGQKGSFTVLGAGGTAGAPVNGGLIALLIMGMLVLATVVILILTRKPA